MIRELAEYEKEPDKVLATEETLRRTLTLKSTSSHHNTNPGFAKTLILRVTSSDTPDVQKVAGMALYFNNYSTWRAKPGIYLEDLYVRPQYRKRGYGKILLKTLAREVLMIDGGRLEWSCLKWNEPSLQFYRGLGAEEMKDWVGLRVDGEALENLARGKVKAMEEEK